MQDDDLEPGLPEIDPDLGLLDPRTLPGGPDLPDLTPAATTEPSESPDVDPPAWEGTEPEEAGRGLIDPRPEISIPEGL